MKRGLYRSGFGVLVNADINGAANILRKSKQKFSDERLCKELTVSPMRIRLERQTSHEEGYIMPIALRMSVK